MDKVYQLKHRDDVLKEGTFDECWEHMKFMFGDMTMRELFRLDVCITSIKK